MEQVKILILINNKILISQIEEVSADIGEPDCKLIKPFEIKNTMVEEIYLESWNCNYTLQDTFMISSDKILTLADPTPTLLEKYHKIIK